METIEPPNMADTLPPLLPGQLSPGWRMVFISAWIGVLAGYGALWQAGRIAGIAPWWLGPETDLRPVFVIAIPYIAPLVALVCGFVGVRASCFVGIGASLGCGAIALGDLHFPGLAVADALIAVLALLVSVACLGGRMRPMPTEMSEPRVLDQAIAHTDVAESVADEVH